VINALSPAGAPVAIEVFELGGSTPVQGWGSIRVGDVERVWYFWARYATWAIEVWAPGEKFGKFNALPPTEKEWSVSADWPGGQFSAGDIDTAFCRKLIDGALIIFVASMAEVEREQKMEGRRVLRQSE